MKFTATAIAAISLLGLFSPAIAKEANNQRSLQKRLLYVGRRCQSNAECISGYCRPITSFSDRRCDYKKKTGSCMWDWDCISDKCKMVSNTYGYCV